MKVARMGTEKQVKTGWLSGEGRRLLPFMGVTLVVAGAAGFLACQWRSRRPEVVFVKTNEVMARYKGAVQAREKFQKDTSVWAEESKQLEQKLQDLGKTAKPTDTKAVEQARQMASRLKALRDKGAQHDQELMQPIVAEVNSSIKKFARNHGYKLVLGTLQGGVVLHGEEALDVTEALITEMNQ